MLATQYRVALACAGLALSCAHAQQHPFTVRDDIAMARISDPHPQPSVPGSEIVWPSPDGRWAAIVTSRGVFEIDKIESKVLLFDLRDMRVSSRTGKPQALQPRLVATVRAFPYSLEITAYGPVIKDLRWSRDSQLLYFRAMGARGKYQLCSIKRDGTGMRWLTSPDKDVTQFDVVGTTIVFIAADPGIHPIDPGRAINPDAVDITGARLQEVLFPRDIAAQAPGMFRLYRLVDVEGRVPIHQTPAYRLFDIPYLSSVYPFSASPSGTQLIKLEPPSSIPESWTKYNPASDFGFFRLKSSPDARFLRADNILRPLEYTLIDLSTGRRLPLLRSPNARSLGYSQDANRVAWSPDAQRVLVTNIFLPLDGTRKDGDRTYPCAAATVDIHDRNVRCAYFEGATPARDGMHLEDVAFGKNEDKILVLLGDEHGKQVVRTYNLDQGKWTFGSTRSLQHPVRSLSDAWLESSEIDLRTTLFVHQGLNEPPTIWAKTSTGSSREVWNPNPQLSRQEFGQASRYDWRDNDGRAWSGILVKPVGYVVGKRYPLVLQLYTFLDDQFITDGLAPTAFAARELAGVGIAVLQMRRQPNRISGDDPLIHLEAYRSAVHHLAEDGLADPAKVGVVGFSWSCWEAEEALVRDANLFAAATIADGLDNNYMQYKLFAVGFEAIQRQMDQIRGGPPFGANLQHWVDEAPGFHLDKVQTPVRIEAINPSSVLQEWELYSSLQLQHKPVDFIYFPEGTHIHQRPLERLESQQGSVDWLRFWLKGEEDPDPSRQAQYGRWRQMRKAKEERADGIPLQEP